MYCVCALVCVCVCVCVRTRVSGIGFVRYFDSAYGEALSAMPVRDVFTRLTGTSLSANVSNAMVADELDDLWRANVALTPTSSLVLQNDVIQCFINRYGVDEGLEKCATFVDSFVWHTISVKEAAVNQLREAQLAAAALGSVKTTATKSMITTGLKGKRRVFN